MQSLTLFNFTNDQHAIKSRKRKSVATAEVPERAAKHIFIVARILSMMAPTQQSEPVWWRNGTFENSKILSDEGNVVFKWSVNTHRKEIHLGLSFPGTGWAGLGLSLVGSMKGADIAMVNKKPSERRDDEHTFQVVDSFSKDFEKPVPDPDGLQNYILIHAERNETHSWFHVKRPLVTCDSFNDIEIGIPPMYVMYAFGPGEEPMYHGPNQRGGSLVSLLVKDLIETEPPLIPQQNILTLSEYKNATHSKTSTEKFALDITSEQKGFEIPAQDTTYVSFKFNLTEEFRGKEAISYSGLKPILGDSLAHHAFLYRCSEESFDEFEENEVEAYIMPDDCMVFLGWTQGMDYVSFPSDVSGKLGGDGDHLFVMQVHYENPGRLQKQLSNFGFRLYYQLAPTRYEYGSLYMVTPFREIMVPAGAISTAKTICPSSCTAQAFPEDGVNLFYVVLHGHKTLKRIAVRHIRNGEELDIIAETDYYDFKKQPSLYVDRKLLPGDTLITECEYDGSHISNAVVGGDSSEDEMCNVFFAVYPKIDIFSACSDNYCGPSSSFALRETNGDPKYTTKVLPRDLQFNPLDPKDDMCYISMMNGVSSPLAWEGLSIDFIIVMSAVVVSFLASCGLLKKYSKTYSAMSHVHKTNTANYVTALIALTTSFVLSCFASGFLTGSQDVFSTDEDGKLTVNESIYFLMTSTKVVIVFFLLELVTKAGNRVGIDVLLHHLVTVVITAFIFMASYHTLSVQFLSVGQVLLLYANTEQPTYIALLRRRFGYTSTFRDFMLASIWAFVSKITIFIYTMIVLTQQRHKFKSHFDFLPDQDSNTISSNIIVVASLSCLLLPVQLYQVFVLYKIARKKSSTSNRTSQILPVNGNTGKSAAGEAEPANNEQFVVICAPVLSV